MSAPDLWWRFGDGDPKPGQLAAIAGAHGAPDVPVTILTESASINGTTYVGVRFTENDAQREIKQGKCLIVLTFILVEHPDAPEVIA